MPKVGDVVLFSYLGRTLNAIVLAARDGEPSHLGANDESILSLAFIDPLRESGASSSRVGPIQQRIGYIPTVFIEHDVVHASHEFSEEFKRAQGLDTPAKIAAIRGHGEWSEVPTPVYSVDFSSIPVSTGSISSPAPVSIETSEPSPTEASDVQSGS